MQSRVLRAVLAGLVAFSFAHLAAAQRAEQQEKARQNPAAAKPAAKPTARAEPKGPTKAEVVSSPTLKYTIHAVTPGWVKPIAAGLVPPSQRAPWHYALIDEQVRVGAQTVEKHMHVVRRIVDASALSEASELTILFNPSYETLTLHEMTLLRDGQRLDKLSKQNIRVLQREENLEQQIYDGRATVSVLVDDARAGDALEYRYTIAGQNSIFENRFVNTRWIRTYRAPAAHLYTRIVHPADRKVGVRSRDPRVQPGVTTQGGETEIVFDVRDVQLAETLSDLPPGLYMRDWADFSEYPDWRAVAEWGTRTFARGIVRSDEIAQRASVIRSAGGSEAQWISRALDFVQRDVRYLAVELGEHSHLPNRADRVLQQRYGDCKDKSVLLVSLLRELGITAYPVLVSTRYRRFVRDHLPSPYAFDHAIVGVDLNGKSYWFDATRRFDAGSLESRNAADFGAGLALREGAADLEDAPRAGPTPVVATYEDDITVKAFSEPARLVSRITYRGEVAQRLIGLWSSPSRAEAEKDYSGQYARRYTGARQTQPFRLVEQPEDNSARIEAEFELPELFSYPEESLLNANVYLWGVMSDLNPGFNSARSQPLYLGPARRVVHTTTLRLPEAVVRDPQDSSTRVDDPHFSMVHRVAHDTRTATFRAELEVRADTVSSAAWQDFHKKTVTAANHTMNGFRFSAVPLSRSPELQKSLLALDNEAARGRSPWVTVVQIRSEARRLVLTEHLNSGRLTERQKASALLAKSIVLNQTGRVNEAMADAKQSLGLSEQPETLHHLAVLQWTRGEFPAALETAKRQREKMPDDPALAALLGRIHFALGDYPAAAAAFGQAAGNATGDAKLFAIVWEMLAAKRTGGDPGAVAGKHSVSGAETRFAGQVIRMLSGGIRPEALLDRARDPSRSIQVSQECEAHFYIGMHHLFAGDAALARRHFLRSLDTKVYEFVEYVAAGIELARLK